MVSLAEAVERRGQLGAGVRSGLAEDRGLGGLAVGAVCGSPGRCCGRRGGRDMADVLLITGIPFPLSEASPGPPSPGLAHP